MRRMWRKRSKWRKRGVRRLFLFGLSVLCVLSVCCAVLFRCRPIVLKYAESQAIWLVTKLANDTALQVLQDQAELCANTISVVYNDVQKVSAVYANSLSINTVRTLLMQTIMETIERNTALSVAVPVGTLSGIHWFSGMGPLITFPISFTATMLSDVSSQITSLSINQSLYSIVIHLYFEMYVVTPGGRSKVSTTYSVPMAETVMLGEVPDNLTEVYGDDQSTLGQIFDYGTNQ